MAKQTILYDACVLYPAPLRDFLMELAITGLFKARWTDQIHQEWIRNVLKNRSDLTLDKLTRTKQMMNACVLDCLVTGYEDIIETITLPDLDDRHVLAAAIQGEADIILTFNLNDFPISTTQNYGIAAQHPDDFVMSLIDLYPETICQVIEKHRSRLKRPPKTADEYLETLLTQGLSQSVQKMRQLCYPEK